ncbi:MAG: hypothetical protein QQN63_14645, partial [Nitrosopumilus sp.]
MTQIISTFNNGNKDGTLTGIVQIGFNVDPSTITAAATPVTLTQSQLNKYNYFKISSGGTTNEFDLPDAAAIGQVLTLFAVAAYELRTETDSNDINEDTNVGYAVAAGEVLTCFKVSSTDWLVTSVSVAGVAATVNATIGP